jgi:hypothetical protein
VRKTVMVKIGVQQKAINTVDVENHTAVHAVSFAGRTQLAAGKHRSTTTFNCNVPHNFHKQGKLKRCHAAPSITYKAYKN